jgi:hypothetical protein
MDPNKPTPSGEIDITQIFNWMRKGFNRMGRNFIGAIAGMRRLFLTHLFYFITVIGLGLTIGLVYGNLLNKKYYRSTMILSSEFFNKRIMENTIDKLNLLCREEDRIGLSELLHVNVETAKNISYFDAVSFVSEQDRIQMEVLKEQLSNVTEKKVDLVNKVMERIEIANVHSFRISLYVYNPNIVHELDTSIVSYFRTNEYVRKRIEIKQSSLLARRDKLVRESRKLDSLKSILYVSFQNTSKTSRDGSNNVIFSEGKLTDPMAVFKEDLALDKEIRLIDNDLYIKPYFEIVDGLTTFKVPENEGMVSILLISLVISIMAGYLILGLWKFNNYLSTVR